jgi:hypothetical protein
VSGQCLRQQIQLTVAERPLNPVSWLAEHLFDTAKLAQDLRPDERPDDRIDSFELQALNGSSLAQLRSQRIQFPFNKSPCLLDRNVL